ncbi:MAG: TetR/AcrR family transcriptional regulator [Candidatus Dormibacteraeota bacterium]|nr:TetR/AcrR family transcriptional regulator [Candidatus Dormibacteraeota bacterium]
MSMGAESEPRRPRTKRSVETRERILAAATEVFARSGFHGARVADIAEQAGIAYGLVYHYFRNKDDILAAIFSERWAQYVEYLHEVGRMPLGFHDRMRRLVHFWVEVYRRDPDLMTIMINEISRSYEFLESHDIGTVLVAFDAIEAMIREARDTGELQRDVDPQLATYVIFGAAEMVLTGYVIGTLRRHSADAYARDEEQMLSLLLNGLASTNS